MALSGCGQEDPFRKKTDVQKSLGPVLAKWNWPASSFLHPIRFRSFTDGPDHIVRHRPGSDSIQDGHVRLWPDGSVLEASRCARITGPSSVKHNRPTSSFPTSDSVPFFHKRPGSYCAIWFLMAMSGCGQMDPIRKQTGVQNSLGLVLAKHNRPASCFPHSIRFRSSTDGLDHIVRNRPRSDLVLDGHVRLWPNGSGPEASWCARIIGPGSGKTEPARLWQNATGPNPI